jgi:hypothetical protein
MLEGEEEDYLLGRSQCATEITQAKVQSRSIWDALCALQLPVVLAIGRVQAAGKIHRWQSWHIELACFMLCFLLGNTWSGKVPAEPPRSAMRRGKKGQTCHRLVH